MRPTLFPAVLAFIANTLMFSAAAADNLIGNGGFEQRELSWRPFVPPESAAGDCNFTTVPNDAHQGRWAAQLEMSTTARFGIFPAAPMLRVFPGERYRLAAWVKAGANFFPEMGTPGIVLRATLFETPTKDLPGGHVFAGIKGVSIGNPSVLAGPVPREWTKIEATIEIPAGANYLAFFIFAWKASGKLLVDEVSMVRVGPTP